MPRPLHRLPRALATLAAAFVIPVASARAGDVTAFVALPTPTENWSRGYGAALTSTWFKVLTFEGEAARVAGETPEAGMTSFTASAFLSPPIGGLVPYGGVGVGLFRQTLGSDSDLGRLRALVLGVKVRLKDLIVLKGEYRRLELSGDPLLAMDSRVSFGAGVSF
jgi:hypothetical protein